MMSCLLFFSLLSLMLSFIMFCFLPSSSLFFSLSFLLLLSRLSPLLYPTTIPFASARSTLPPPHHLPYPYAYRKPKQHRSERYHIPSFTNSTTKQAFSSANFTYENYNSHNLFQLLLRFNDRVCRLFRLMYPAHFLQRCANRVALYLLNSDRGFP
jgi:hypothetical protein